MNTINIVAQRMKMTSDVSRELKHNFRNYVLPSDLVEGYLSVPPFYQHVSGPNYPRTFIHKSVKCILMLMGSEAIERKHPTHHLRRGIQLYRLMYPKSAY